MREIKFRAWDEKEKCWVVGFAIHQNGMFSDWAGCKEVNGKCYADANWEQLKNIPHIKVMQYTGLKDKNGKEIYEGDIVTGESFETSMLKHWKTGLLKHYVPEMYVIKYHEASFKTFDLKGRWVAVLNHHVSSKVEDLQVIGNVFENPELLEVKRNE